MINEKITINALINADKEAVWDYYTNPEHITKWNFADPSWHCPKAANEMKIGGKYFSRMEAKDGSFGFDMIGIYTEINHGDNFTYEFDERKVTVSFHESNNQTEVVIRFTPETENPIELQQRGWQAILNNFKAYVETR